MKITEEAPIEVEVIRSQFDGALVVQIDSTPDTGKVRVFMNDADIWDGDPEADDQPLTVGVPQLEPDTYNRLVAYLINLGARDALFLANEVREQIGASAQRRAERENR